MELAFATGHGPALLTNLEGREPYVREEDACRVRLSATARSRKQYGSQPLPAAAARIRSGNGARGWASRPPRAPRPTHVARDELDGFFIHVDADCLDDAIMPAVDYRLPGGLAWASSKRRCASRWRAGGRWVWRSQSTTRSSIATAARAVGSPTCSARPWRASSSYGKKLTASIVRPSPDAGSAENHPARRAARDADRLFRAVSGADEPRAARDGARRPVPREAAGGQAAWCISGWRRFRCWWPICARASPAPPPSARSR